MESPIFAPEYADALNASIYSYVSAITHTGSMVAMRDLFILLDGYAEHLAQGLLMAGFEEADANSHAWDTAWGSLHRVLMERTSVTPEFSSCLEQNLSNIYPYQETSSTGEPLDPVTRGFYRTFFNHLELPAVHRTADWLY